LASFRLGVYGRFADLRLKSNFPNGIKLFLPVQSQPKKYSGFQKSQITPYLPPSTPLEARIAIVTDAGLDAVAARSASDESASCGRQNRVVLTPRRRRQVCGKQFSQATVTRKPDRRGEYDISRKTIACGDAG